MSREDYLNRQRASNARYDTDRAVARAHLEVASALAKRREELGKSTAEVSADADLPLDRLEMIEEGDTTSLTEILRLCHSLGLTIIVDEHFRVEVAARSVVSTSVADVR